MAKSPRKAIILRSKLKNNFNKKDLMETKLLRQTKAKYFSDINVKCISDNKKFWKTIKPFFSKKGLSTNIILVENNEIECEEEIKHYE